jgi:putative ABC transport system permease protein
MIGLHGLVSYETSRRTFDIGVRRALGASTRSMINLVLKDAAFMVAGGAIIGVLLMAAASEALPPFAGYALGPIDFAASIGLLMITTVLACLGSARAACKVDASVALRTE